MFGSEGNVCLKKDKVGKGYNRKSPNLERKSNLYIDIEIVLFIEMKCTILFKLNTFLVA